jgi:hypothetical protein
VPCAVTLANRDNDDESVNFQALRFDRARAAR